MRRLRAVSALSGFVGALVVLVACNEILGVDPDSLKARPKGSVGVAPSALSFGGVACGKEGAPEQVTLTNTTAEAVSWTAVIKSGPSSPFSISSTGGTIPPKGEATIGVTIANAIPTDGGLVSYSDTFIVTTSSLDASANVTLTGGAQGAILIVDHSSLSFPTTAPGNVADASFTVSNQGDLAATFALDAGPGFVFSPANVTLLPDASATVGVQFTPIQFGTASVQVSLSAAEPSCAPAPTVSVEGESIGSVAQLDVGLIYACALLKTGGLVCWGYHPNSTSTVSPSTTPTLVSGFPVGETITQISAGTYHMCALGTSGAVYCWGDNQLGELGNGALLDAGTPAYQAAPSPVMSLTDVVTVTAGNRSTCAVVRHGATADQVWCWGSGEKGQLGNGQTGVGVASSIPVRVSLDDDGGAFPNQKVQTLVVGNFNSCAILEDGSAYCWGTLYEGANGDNGANPNGYPSRVVVGGTDIVSLAAGANFYASCSVTRGHDVYCWGDNDDGEIGNGMIDDASVGVPAGYRIPSSSLQGLQVTSGYGDFCALNTEGWVTCWGRNFLGQTGFDPAVSASTTTPTDVPYVGDGNLVSVRAGVAMTCALRSTGEVLCWGSNNSGELGVGFANPTDAGDGYQIVPHTVLGFQ